MKSQPTRPTNKRRRTECVEQNYIKGLGPLPAIRMGNFLPWTHYATPNDPDVPVEHPVWEPWVLSISVKAAFYNAGGANLGITDYGGLRLQATFVDYDLYDDTGRPPIAPATYGAFANNERGQDVAAIDLGSAIFRRMYASNATSDGYPVPRACLPDSLCQYPRSYYWPLLLYSEIDTTSLVGTIPAGGLPDQYSIRILWTVDHEWRERGA